MLANLSHKPHKTFLFRFPHKIPVNSNHDCGLTLGNPSTNPNLCIDLQSSQSSVMSWSICEIDAQEFPPPEKRLRYM